VPTSQHRQISSIIDVISHLHPRSVLDVGVGVGTYGFLCAVSCDQDRLLASHPQSPVLRLVGIEGFEPYIGPIQRAIYNEIFIGNLLDLLPTFSSKEYDLLLLIDVLEHIDPCLTDDVLAMCRRVSRATLVSTPHVFEAQGPLLSNELENHRSRPTQAQMRSAGYDLLIPDDTSLIAFASDDQEFIRYYRTRLRRSRIRAALPMWSRKSFSCLRAAHSKWTRNGSVETK
jgi:hypothetical protein